MLIFSIGWADLSDLGSLEKCHLGTRVYVAVRPTYWLPAQAKLVSQVNTCTNYGCVSPKHSILEKLLFTFQTAI